MELARSSGVHHSAVRREVLRLVGEGILRRWPHSEDPRPKYDADPAFPAYLQLRRLMCLLSGPAVRFREAATKIDPSALLWIHGPYAEAPATLAPIRLAAIARQPRLLRKRLHEVGGDPEMVRRRLIVDAMSIEEWVTRLEKREMRLLAIRRAQRLWIVGDGDSLRRRERAEIEARTTLKNAIKNWREELSDEWDENWDPFDPRPQC
jgi:hypothetical protein